MGVKLDGAVEWSRTTDLLITNHLLSLTMSVQIFKGCSGSRSAIRQISWFESGAGRSGGQYAPGCLRDMGDFFMFMPWQRLYRTNSFRGTEKNDTKMTQAPRKARLGAAYARPFTAVTGVRI